MSEKPHRGDLTLQGFEVDRTVAGITIMGNYARPTSANNWDKHLQELHCVVFALHNQSGQKQQVQNPTPVQRAPNCWMGPDQQPIARLKHTVHDENQRQRGRPLADVVGM